MPASAHRVTNDTRQADLATRAGRAANFVRRGLGLMGQASLPAGGGLIIEPCNGIVMFFMHFPLDVIFVDDRGEVVHLLHGIRPWRVSRIVRQSRLVVELPAGTLRQTGTQLGDHITIASAG